MPAASAIATPAAADSSVRSILRRGVTWLRATALRSCAPVTEWQWVTGVCRETAPGHAPSAADGLAGCVAQLAPAVAIEAVIAWLDAGQPDPARAAARVRQAVMGVIGAASAADADSFPVPRTWKDQHHDEHRQGQTGETAVAGQKKNVPPAP